MSISIEEYNRLSVRITQEEAKNATLRRQLDELCEAVWRMECDAVTVTELGKMEKPDIEYFDTVCTLAAKHRK